MKRTTIILIAASLLMLLSSAFVFAAEKIYFYHTDPAGTPLAMSDDKGNIVWKANYKPFGEEQVVTGTLENNEKFVGKEKDKETQHYYFGARYMKGETGRFISPEPVGPVDAGTGNVNQKVLHNPQLLNPYAYALNNPYKYLDPDGHAPLMVSAKGYLEFRQQLLGWAPTWVQELFMPSNPAGSIGPMAMESGGEKLMGQGIRKAINITEQGLEHVLERHVAGGSRAAGKSIFSVGEDILDLLSKAEGVAPAQQAGGNYQRIVDAGRTIGIDRATDTATSIYTVITDKAGSLVTAFPGTP